MTRSILNSLCLAAAIFSVPARVLAVWPPSTSFEAEQQAGPAGAQVEKLTPALHQDVQAITNKLQQDERRLEKVIEDLKDDEAALKKLNQGLNDHRGFQ
jgi:hypothetical protein